MNAYSIELFVHVAGVVIVFMGYGALLFATAALRRAKTIEEVRAIARIVGGRKVAFEYISMIDLVVIVGAVLLVASGVTMALSVWGFGRGWIAVSIVTIVALGPLGAFVLSPRLHRIAVIAAETPDGPLPDALFALTHDWIVTTTLSGATAGLLGVLFLMTNKPSLAESIVVEVAAVAVGVAVALPAWRGTQHR